MEHRTNPKFFFLTLMKNGSLGLLLSILYEYTYIVKSVLTKILLETFLRLLWPTLVVSTCKLYISINTMQWKCHYRFAYFLLLAYKVINSSILS